MTTGYRDITIVAVIVSGFLHALLHTLLYMGGVNLSGLTLIESLHVTSANTFQLVVVILLSHWLFGWKQKRNNTNRENYHA